MDTKASADIHLAIDWLRLPFNYKYQALEALDRAILELRNQMVFDSPRDGVITIRPALRPPLSILYL